MKNIAVFASGAGTNAENIIRYFAHSKTVHVSLVVSNKATAGVHGRASRLGVPSVTFSREDFDSGLPVLEYLRRSRIDWIILAGFLCYVAQPLLDAYRGKILNIHPSLLPKFGGKGMYGHRVHEAVLQAGEQESGITIHLVDERYDEGDIVYQASCPVLPDDTPDSLAARVHALEYRYYPEVIERCLSAE